MIYLSRSEETTRKEHIMSEFNYSLEEIADLNRAIMTLKDHCRSYNRCAGCPFQDRDDASDTYCMLSLPPQAWWEVE